ncbi:MAG TPA: PQQ-binding-like beta-propeller repeat protein [Sphingobium sp.]|nr:PQQ-binding-like beta-propeller repeat protein [Sphingobium sp.]
MVDSSDWLRNGGPLGDHFSPLTQINASNVGKLEVAWQVDLDEGRLQAQPLVLDGVVYLPTPKGNLLAIDGATGATLWEFKTGLPEGQPIRGLESHGSGSARRLLFASRNFIFAIDPATGTAIRSFGDNGRVDIRENLRGPAEDNGMYITTPGVVFENLYIFSGRVSESTPSSPGDIRAIDVMTGEFRWTFHTIPHPGEFGVDTWPKDAHLTQGGANSWAGSALDAQRGIVFVVTGSAADDFYGGNRLGDNLFANSLIALDARTGKRLWHFQAVRHDLWDMDFNSPPVLLTVNRNGRKVDAVAVTPKTGWIYIFDRVTGEPLFPIDEVEVPASTVPGEVAARTQPIPRLPAPLARTRITLDDLTDRTPEAAEWARGVYTTLNGEGRQFVPMMLEKDTLVLTGFVGAVNWGGMAADRNGVLYANASELPGISRIVESSSLLEAGLGERTYSLQCAACHGAQRLGVPPDFPSLVDIGSRLSEEEIAQVIEGGKGRMPGFGSMPAETRRQLVSFLLTGRDTAGARAPSISLQGRFAPSQTRYTSNGNRNFVDPDGYPGVKPPWGTLNAIDMNTGEYLWRIPFGATDGYGTRFGGRNTGGAVVTASGLLFIGATSDRMFHAFDTRTGRLLWEAELSAPGEATPATYMVGGRQYVIIAASDRDAGAPAPAANGGGLAAEGAGHSAGRAAPSSGSSPPRNRLIAFALPKD